MMACSACTIPLVHYMSITTATTAQFYNTFKVCKETTAERVLIQLALSRP